MNICDVQADNVFGPRVVTCREGFDFTLLFEQTILSAVPSTLAIAVSTGCVLYLLRQSRKTKPGTVWSLREWKQTSILCFTFVQLALVVLWATPSNGPTKISLPASVLSMMVGLALAAVSYLEHGRSIRPSAVLNTYLALSILFDAAQARTLWLRRNNGTVASVFTTGIILKVFILLGEMVEKRGILKAPYSSYPPEALGGVLNRSVFWWINSLLIRGSSARLHIDDLFDIDKKLTSEHIGPRLRHHWKMSNKSSSYSLLWASLRCFWVKVLTIVFFRLCLTAIRFSQPLLINRAVSLLRESDSPEKRNTGNALIGATALIYISIALVTGSVRHNIYRLITMVRSGLIILIYDTTLNLDTQTANESSALTLMSTDIDCIAKGLEVFDSLWADPIEVVIAMYLLYNQIGLAFVAPIVTSLLFVAPPIMLRGASATAQKEWLEFIERRVAATASILHNIKGVKMTGLCKYVGEKLQDYRISELKISGKYRKVLGISVTIGTVSHAVIPVITLITYVLMIRANSDISLTTPLAFTTLSLVSMVAYPVEKFVKAVTHIAAAAGCFQRIQTYICSIQDDFDHSIDHDVDHDTNHCMDYDINPPPQDDLGSSLQHQARNDFELRDLQVTQNGTNSRAIIATYDADFAFPSVRNPIISGITLSISKGSWILLTGPIGCGKSVLLLSLLGELRLLKGSMHRSPSLSIGFCAQEPWLPNLTIRKIIIGHTSFDDKWYLTVLDACVLPADLRELPAGDHTVIGSNGVSLSGGQRQRLSLARAIYSRKSVLILDDILSGLDPTTEQAIVDNVFGKDGLLRKQGVAVLLATHSVRHAWRADHVVIMEKGGTILEQGQPAEMMHLRDMDDKGQTPQSSSTSTSPAQPSAPFIHERAGAGTENIQPRELSHETSRQTGDLRLYAYYFRALGWITTLGLVSTLLIYTVFLKFPTLWVRWWSEAEEQNPGKQTDRYAGFYGLFCGICVLSLGLAIFLLFGRGIPRSATNMHAWLLKAVMEAPYWFFVQTDTGEIINRFSQDMSLLCLQLPFAFVDVTFSAGVCIVGAVLITLASKWSVAIFPGLIAMLYILQKFYLRTSRQIRLLDIEAKAPLYTHFLETLRGMITIKAFGWQRASIQENAALLDRSQRPYYLMYSIQRWLNLVLDLLVAGIATLIVALATHLKGSSAGALGVALLNILTFSSDLTYLIRAWTELETSLGAIARVKSFETDTPRESLPEEKREPTEGWPFEGRVELKNLSSNYRAGTELALKNISLQIPAGSRVGICGRTGSGKSTLILTLLRLAEVASGDIIVDGIPIKTVPRGQVRQGTIAMPQEPLLLPGTVRFNADPLSEHSDEDILSALDEVGVLDIISSRGGLNTQMESIPLSRGQQQLFCLTRAILSNSRIVVLDEVTSNVDALTEAKMMDLIRKKFSGRTILAVAHHLRTIRHFDTIVVLDQGRIIEIGSPGELLKRQSKFRELWERHE